MCAHRGINATGNQRILQYLAVNSLAHAVQALQFKGRASASGNLQDGGDGGGIVGGKLRVNRIGGLQQGLGARQIGNVGVVLVGEDRIKRQPLLLRALDFGVPVGTLDQATHQTDLVFSTQRRDVFN